MAPGTPARSSSYWDRTRPRFRASWGGFLLPFGSDRSSPEISAAGRTPVDFHIAFYIGTGQHSSSAARFTIVSCDTGFDPWVRHHLGTLAIACRRINAIARRRRPKKVASVPRKTDAGTAGAVPKADHMSTASTSSASAKAMCRSTDRTSPRRRAEGPRLRMAATPKKAKECAGDRVTAPAPKAGSLKSATAGPSRSSPRGHRATQGA